MRERVQLSFVCILRREIEGVVFAIKNGGIWNLNTHGITDFYIKASFKPLALGLHVANQNLNGCCTRAAINM